MIQNKFGELIFSSNDICDLLMQGHDVASMKFVVDQTVTAHAWPDFLNPVPEFVPQQIRGCTEAEFHKQQQQNWHMPVEYKTFDIAAHVLDLCNSQAELQRCGQELLMYQERDLFELLRYLKYLVDTMKQHSIIWGVGRGSSVSSYVLYKLGVHRIDSMYYNLDIAEFLR